MVENASSHDEIDFDSGECGTVSNEHKGYGISQNQRGPSTSFTDGNFFPSHTKQIPVKITLQTHSSLPNLALTKSGTYNPNAEDMELSVTLKTEGGQYGFSLIEQTREGSQVNCQALHMCTIYFKVQFVEILMLSLNKSDKHSLNKTDKDQE